MIPFHVNAKAQNLFFFLFFLLFLMISFFSFANQAMSITWVVRNPCSHEAHAQGEFDYNHPHNRNQSLGTMSLLLFKQNNIPFIGNEMGINSILKTPTGLETMEILSETSMRAYGWCYEVNGQLPELMPHQLLFSTNDDHFEWFYGYALYEDGVWTEQCSPAHLLKNKPQFLLCKN